MLIQTLNQDKNDYLDTNKTRTRTINWTRIRTRLRTITRTKIKTRTRMGNWTCMKTWGQNTTLYSQLFKKANQNQDKNDDKDKNKNQDKND